MIWLAGLLALYLALLIGLTIFSLRPYRIPTWISLGALGHPLEEVEIVASDGVRLSGSWTPAPNSKKIAVFFHGYFMNKCELVPEAHYLVEQGFSCLLLDFRAHGKSQGAPCSIGVCERLDVKAAVDFARGRQPDSKVLLVGSSMGAAALIFALAEDPSLADAAIIDSGYSRLSLAISGWWRWLGGPFLQYALYPTTWLSAPFSGVNPYRVDLAKTLPKIGPKPLLFMHGTRDSLALPSEARRNFEAAIGPKSIHWFEGCNHSEGRWEKPEEYRQAMADWLATTSL